MLVIRKSDMLSVKMTLRNNPDGTTEVSSEFRICSTPHELLKALERGLGDLDNVLRIEKDCKQMAKDMKAMQKNARLQKKKNHRLQKNALFQKQKNARLQKKKNDRLQKQKNNWLQRAFNEAIKRDDIVELHRLQAEHEEQKFKRLEKEQKIKRLEKEWAHSSATDDSSEIDYYSELP